MEASNEEYAAFCEYVRCETIRISSLIMAGRHQDAGLKSLALCEEATRRKEQMRMEGEVSAPERYDLASLTLTGKDDEQAGTDDD